jgi:hypothetical protein
VEDGAGTGVAGVRGHPWGAAGSGRVTRLVRFGTLRNGDPSRLLF